MSEIEAVFKKKYKDSFKSKIVKKMRKLKAKQEGYNVIDKSK